MKISGTYRLNHSSSLVPYLLAQIYTVWDVGFIYWIICWILHYFSLQAGRNIPMHLSQAGLFGQVLWVWLPSLTQHSHWKWQISWLPVGFSSEYCCIIIFIYLGSFAENLHLSSRFTFLFGMLLVSYLPIFFFIAMHFKKVGGEVPKWIYFFQRSARGRGRPIDLIPVTLTNVRCTSRPFQPRRLDTLVSAPGEAMSWNVPYHSLCCLQTTCPVNALSAPKYCAIKSSTPGLTCSASLAPRKHNSHKWRQICIIQSALIHSFFACAEFTETQNSWGWKGSLEVIWCNPSSRRVT